MQHAGNRAQDLVKQFLRFWQEADDEFKFKSRCF